MKYLSKTYYYFGYLLFFLLVLGDLLTIKNPLFGKMATVLWLLSFVYFFIFALKCLVTIILRLDRFKSIFTFFLLLVWFSVLMINIPQSKNLSGETTQEISCVLNHFLASNDWGYGKTCFFGYPAKQHLLPALPSLIWGRTLFALHFGGSLYFLLGMIIFAGGILEYFQFKKSGDLVCAILLSSIFHFHFVNHFLFAFEQSIFPFSFGLIITGLFLFYLAEKNKIPLYLLGFCLLYLIFSYTPSLALYFLSIAVLLYLLLVRKASKRERLIFITLIVFTLISFYFSLRLRGDIKLWTVEVRSQKQLIGDIFQTFRHLVFQKEGTPIVSPVYNFIFITLLVSSLLFIFDWKMGIVGFWILITIIFSVVSQGYTYYGVDFRLHRATVIFPIFLAMIAGILKEFNLESKNKYLFGVMIVVFITGIYFQYSILKIKEPSRYFSFITWLKNNFMFGESEKMKRNLYFISEAHDHYGSINDVLQYFIPQLISKKSFLNNCDIPKSKGIFVIRVDNPCYISLVNSSFANYGVYQYRDDVFGVFENNESSISKNE